MYRIWALILFASLAGCTNIPQRELEAYTAAVGAARSAGEDMVQDWSAARAELERREAARAAPANVPPPEPIPLTWTPPSASTAQLSAEKVRLLAWETIGEFTAILAALNAGESVDAVKSSAGRLFDLAGKIATAGGSSIPGGGPLLEIFQELAGQLEMARLAKEFERAVRGGTPIVRKMLMVLQADTNDHYVLRATLAAADYERTDLEEGLSERDIRQKKARIKAEIDEFRQSLANYVRLLDQTDNSLRALESALDKPIDFTLEANRILDVVLDLRAHWVAYQNARAEAKF